jgi:hypothetical protein
MERYFFHIRDAEGLIPDDEGTLFETLEEATAEARASARDLAVEHIRNGARIVRGAVEMALGDGGCLLSVPLTYVAL